MIYGEMDIPRINMTMFSLPIPKFMRNQKGNQVLFSLQTLKRWGRFFFLIAKSSAWLCSSKLIPSSRDPHSLHFDLFTLKLRQDLLESLSRLSSGVRRFPWHFTCTTQKWLHAQQSLQLYWMKNTAKQKACSNQKKLQCKVKLCMQNKSSLFGTVHCNLKGHAGGIPPQNVNAG